MIKYLKENYKIFLLSLIYGVITYSLYFQAHYVHDTYRIYNFGFLQNLDGLWTQGRPISMWFNILFNFLNITPRIAQIITVFLTILFLSISMTIIYILVIKRIGKNITTKLKILTFVAINGLLFNVYITEWMLFFESAIIALGCLLSIIGTYYLLECKNTHTKYILSSLFFIVGIFCYQASIAIAGSIVVLFTIYDNKDAKISIIIKRVILNMIPYALALIANFSFIKIVNLANVSDSRLSGNIDILYNLQFSIKQILWDFIYMFNFPTRYIVAIITVFTFLFYFFWVIIKKENKLNLLYISVSIFTLCFLSILPMLAMSSNSIYFIARSTPYIASMFPFILIFILLYNNNLFNKSKPLHCLLIIYTMIVTISIIQITSECLKNNFQDITIAKEIQKQIDNYEKETNNKIDTIILLPDTKITSSNKNINYYGDNSVRATSSYYGTKEIMYFANKRDYKVTEGTYDQKKDIFGNMEFDDFDIEQIKYDNNIMYLLRY